MIPKAGDVGVVVGRFQVHELHAAHVELITSVTKSHKHTIVVLGLSQARGTTLNPLDFEARRQMILAGFPQATVLYIKDEQDDAVWSRKLDALLEDTVSLAQTVTLYGGRDSFIARYCGRHTTQELEPDAYVSGTELRKTISKSVRGTPDFRAGVIWASANGFPRTFPAVDIAVYRRGTVMEWLLVRKPGEALWRFPGGFVQPSDDSYELAAKRELAEETGIEVGEMTYVTSHRVDDWRYRGEADKIMTTLYAAEHTFGAPKPADDVAEAGWVGQLNLFALVPEHRPLLAPLVKWVAGREAKGGA